jgi:hypothetical protein
MNQTLIELFEVTTCALNQTIYQKPITDDKAFYFKTLENGLSGLIFSALDENKITRTLFEHLEKDTMLYILKDSLQIEAIDMLGHYFNEHMIDHLFLKGSRLKKIYPESHMRAMGDIDVLIHPKDLHKVHQVMDQHGIQCIGRSKIHDIFEMENKLKIEIHSTVNRDFIEKYEALFKDTWKYTKHVEHYLYELSREYELVYLLYHLAKHIHLSGVGIRSILDIGLYLRTYQQEINQDLLIEYLNQSNMYPFFQSMIYLNHRYFSIENIESWITGYKMEEDFYEVLTEYLATSGIHGKGNHFNPFTPRMASSKLKHQHKMTFILSVIFPDLESVKGMYPFVRKYPILLPVGWMFRWANLIFKHPKSTMRKISKLNINDQEIDKITDIFQKIGL